MNKEFDLDPSGEGDDLKAAAIKIYKPVMEILDEIYGEEPEEWQLEINRVIWEQWLEEKDYKLGKNQNTPFGFSCN